VDEFQKCQCVPANAGTELHHPNVDVCSAHSAQCQHAQLHDVVFGNGNACLTARHQAFADGRRKIGFRNPVPSVSSQTLFALQILQIASALLRSYTFQLKIITNRSVKLSDEPDETAEILSNTTAHHSAWRYCPHLSEST